MNFVKFGYLSRKYGYSNPTSTAFQNWAGFCIYLDPLRHADLDASVIYLRQRNRGCLLDVGCGTGETLRTMRDLGWEVEGLDPDPVAGAARASAGSAHTARQSTRLQLSFGSVRRDHDVSRNRASS